MQRYTSCPPHSFALFFLALVLLAACREKTAETLPPQYQQKGSFIQSLPYFNPDSCVLLVRRDVPQRWQGAAYENLILDGPEDSPLELGFKHLDFYEKNFPADTAREFAQLWRGRFYTHLGKLDSARLCLQDCYGSSSSHRRFARAADAQEAIANTHVASGNIGEAIRAHLTVFETVNQLDATQNLRKYTNIASLANAYYSSNNPREALRWLNRAHVYVQDEKHPISPEAKVDFFSRHAVYYWELDMPDSALLFARQAFDFHLQNKTINDRTQLLQILGSAYQKKGDCSMAKKYLLEAINSQRGNNPDRRGMLDCILAEVYLCLGKLDSAALLYQTALPLVKDFAAKNHALSSLSEIDASKGNYKPAYENLRTVYEAQTKMYNPQKIQEIGAMRAEIELELEKRKAAEIAHKAKIARQQNLIALLFALLAAGFLFSLFLRQRARRRILEQEKQLLDQKNQLLGQEKGILEKNKTLLEQENQLLEKDKTLLAKEKELAETRERLKTQELERSERSLKTTQSELEQTTHLLQLKNQLIQDLEMRLQDSQPSDPGDAENVPAAATAAPLFRMKILKDADWERFRERFEQSFPGFQFNLRAHFPDLTAAETRLFLLLKLRFTNKEISEALAISPDSVYRSRNRLSKKLGVADTAVLDEFIRVFH